MKQYLIKILALLLVGLLLLGVSACKKDDETDTPDTSDTVAEEENGEETPSDEESDGDEDGQPALATKTLKLHSRTVGSRNIGVRHIESASQINCDAAGSGVELNIKLEGNEMTFVVSASATCRFRAYVDGNEWKNADGSVYFTVGTEDTSITLGGLTEGEHNIRLIKVTDAITAQAQIKSLTYAGTIKTEPTDKSLYIEFVGDAFTGGSGRDSDVAMLYSYKTAIAMNADYSIHAFDGHGLLAGERKVIDNYGKTSPTRDATASYDFGRKADMVVVNIGAVDIEGDVSAEDFASAYNDLLVSIRRENGADCKIYCLYGVGGDKYNDAIKQSCQSLGGDTAGYYTLDITGMSQDDIATALTEKLNATKDNTVVPSELKGVGTVIEWSDDRS